MTKPLSLAIGASLLALVAGAPSASALTFTNPAPIALDTHTTQATPYPSNITVGGLAGNVTKATASISGLSIEEARKVALLLVGPGGQSAVLMANTCAGAATNLTLSFDDAAPASLPASGPCSSGTYQPTSVSPGADWFPPAPAPPYGAALSSFNTVAPNGTWSLYVHTDTSMTQLLGTIAGGWSLQLIGPTQAATGQRAAALARCKKKHSHKKRKKCRKKANTLPV